MPTYQWRKNIKILRKKLGLTQVQLASQLNVSDGTISNWESGASSPDLQELLELCKILGVSTDTFFNDTQLIEKSKSSKNSLNTQPITQGNTQENDQNHKIYTEKPPPLQHLNEDMPPYGDPIKTIQKMKQIIEGKEETIQALKGQIKALESALSHAEARLEEPPRSKSQAG